MKNFFQKLDRAASRWLNEFDGQMEQPITQVMTGDVFTYQAAADDSIICETQATVTPTSGLSQRVDKDDMASARPARFRPTGMVANQ